MNTRPAFLYGTAWKKDETTRLVKLALDAGFRGIDTANQLKHYDEEKVGAALAGVPRDTLWLQTKFTSVDGQDHRLPYDPSAALATQVKQSFESSLKHLRTDVLDSYILHGPYSRRGLGEADWEVWGAMEALQKAGKTRAIGVSNVNAGQVRELIAKASIKPAYVQNRCYAVMGWDHETREICRENGVVYQGFSLLTANVDVLGTPPMREIARRHSTGIAQVVFRFAQQVGMLPLTGTTDPEHMREDLACDRFTLAPEELRVVEEIGL
jgi:diketogulonate reductase-like aldo/keto reductase